MAIIIPDEKIRELIGDYVVSGLIENFDYEVLQKSGITKDQVVDAMMQDENYLKFVEGNVIYSIEENAEHIFGAYSEAYSEFYDRLADLEAEEWDHLNREKEKEIEQANLKRAIKLLEKAGYKVNK